jgi:hypothetical protein
MRRQGHIVMYNGLDIQQSRYFINKISVQTWLTKMLAPYLADWLEIPTTPFPTPLGSSESFLKHLYSTVGDPSPKVQAALEKSMGLNQSREKFRSTGIERKTLK